MKLDSIARCGRRLERFERGDDGGALVEFAFAAPVLLLLAVGAFDFGMAFQQKHLLASAAQAGAQIAVQERSLSEVPVGDIIARVRAEANDTGNTLIVTPTYFCVCPEGGAEFACDTEPLPCAAAPGRLPSKYIQVDVRRSFDLVFDYPGVAKTVPLQATSTMRVR